MEDQEIRIVTLPAMRVASFHAFGSSPETEAKKMMVTWAKSHSYWKEAPAVRIFGFNNPDPSEDNPNNGYELWLTIGPNVHSDDETKIKDFPGGLYAVLHCDVTTNPWEIIPSSFGRLAKWRESNQYKFGNHQWLEEHLSRFESNDQGFVLDLYLPIIE